MRWAGSRLPLRPRALSVRDGERQDACGRVCEPPDCSEGFTEGSMDGSPGPLIGSRNTVTIRGWGGPLARVHRPSRSPRSDSRAMGARRGSGAGQGARPTFGCDQNCHRILRASIASIAHVEPRIPTLCAFPQMLRLPSLAHPIRLYSGSSNLDLSIRKKPRSGAVAILEDWGTFRSCRFQARRVMRDASLLG